MVSKCSIDYLEIKIKLLGGKKYIKNLGYIYVPFLVHFICFCCLVKQSPAAVQMDYNRWWIGWVNPITSDVRLWNFIRFPTLLSEQGIYCTSCKWLPVVFLGQGICCRSYGRAPIKLGSTYMVPSRLVKDPSGFCRDTSQPMVFGQWSVVASAANRACESEKKKKC